MPGFMAALERAARVDHGALPFGFVLWVVLGGSRFFWPGAKPSFGLQRPPSRAAARVAVPPGRA